MRNLKRALSLALAVVMVVGLMVVGASAAGVEDFGDYAGIKNKEAVGLLVDLGVIKGGNDGNFSPKGTLTRGEFAKIAYLLSQTQTDYTRYAGTGVAKDAAGHWSEGALVWCNTWRNQIITGGTDGNFYPNDKLTVVQCAVMMLRVLGYNNYLEGFTGAGWEIRTLNKADEAGLMKGLENLKAGDPISRDDACLMAFNALLAKRVYHEEQWNPTAQTMVPTGYAKDYFDGSEGKKDTLLANTFKAEAATVEVASFDDANGVYKDKAGKEITGLSVTPDMIGTTVSYYKIGEKVLASSATSTANTVATFDGLDWAAKIKSEKNQKGFDVSKASFFENGKTAADAEAAKIGAGSIVVLIDTDPKTDGVELVHVTNKTFAYVGAKGVKTETDKDGKTTVTVAGVIDTPTNVNNVEGYKDLKAGDAVLFVTAGGKTTIEKAEKITGKVSSVTDGTVYNVGSNKLTASGLVKDAGLKADFRNEYNFFLDNYGHVVAVKSTAPTPEAPDVNFAVTSAFGYIPGKNSTALGEDKTPDVFQAELLLTDGTKKIVEIVGYKNESNDYAVKPGKDQTELTDKVVEALKGGKIVSYTVDKDGKYSMEEVGEDLTKMATTGATLTGGKPAFADGLLGNKDTLFLVKVKGEKTVRVITGIAGLPTSTYATSGEGDKEVQTGGIVAGQSFTADVSEGKPGDFVTIAYIELAGVDGVKSKPQLAYFIDNTKRTQTADGYEVKAIVEGKEVTLTVESKAWKDIEKATGLNAVVYNTKNQVIEASNEDLGLTKKENVTAKGEFLAVDGETNKLYIIDPDAVIYKIAGGKAEIVSVDGLEKALAPMEKGTYNALVELGTGSEADTIFTMYIEIAE